MMTRTGWDSVVFLASTTAWLPLLLDAALKGLIVLAAAGVVCLFLRRASAAVRHLVWCVAIGQAVVMPLLSLALPGWQLPVLPAELATLQTASSRAHSVRPLPAPDAVAPTAARSGPAGPVAQPALSATGVPSHPVTAPTRPVLSTPRTAPVEGGAAPRHDWAWVLLVWLLGAALAATPVLIGTLSLWCMAPRVRPLTDRSWAVLLESLTARLKLQRPVRLRQSDQVSVPMTWGVLRPIVLLPADAESWPEERRRLVLLHELAHIQRADCLTQMLAQLACAFYWFNPLTWLAARQLRMERERACDDRVLQAGARASDYAQHLLEIARGARGASCASLAAVAMARPSQLEGRLLAVLDGGRSRRAVSRLAALAAVVAGCGAVLPLAALEAAARGGQSPKNTVIGSEGMVSRRVWAGLDDNVFAKPSPDGRYLSFIDWDSGDLAICDLTTGKSRRLTNKGPWSASEEWAESSLISPDGKQVAYTWWNEKDSFYDLRLIGRDGSRRRILYHNPERVYIWLFDWSPDGRQILARFDLKDKTSQMALISVADGSARVLKSFPRGVPGEMRLSPDGRAIAYHYRQQAGTTKRDIFLLATDGIGETPLVQHPANEEVIGWTPDGKSLLFVSDRTGTRGIWRIRIEAKKAQGAPELVKREMGAWEPLGLTRNGALYYAQQSGIMDVYVADLDPATGKLLAPPQPANPRLEGANCAPAWSPDGRYLAYLSAERKALRYGIGDRARILSILAVEGGDTREFALKEAIYQPSWSRDGRALLVVGGGVSRIDAQTGTANAIPNTGNRRGEVYWSPDGETIFFRESGGIKTRDLGTGRDKELHRADGIRTLAVSPDGRQLAFQAKDRETQAWALKVMPVAGGEPRELLRVKESEQIATVAWMPDGRHLLFARGSWQMDPRKRAAEVWRIPVAGGAPQRLGLAMDRLRGLSVHPDGRRIAFTAGLPEVEIWVMENLFPAAQTVQAPASQR
jgi:Tol biopolymer transport system component/beta-lactamase regulating signal transducer with metallopeptidase domain